ncbi:MAG: hypothetical protein ACREI8_07455, partial [Myxococcota bacterium]
MVIVPGSSAIVSRQRRRSAGARLSATPFQEALKAIAKPLEFAAAEDFARLARVKDIERGVAAACARALALALPPDVKRVIGWVEVSFAKPLAEAEQKRAIQRALAALAPLREPAFPDATIARPLSGLAGIGPKRAQQLAQRGL